MYLHLVPGHGDKGDRFDPGAGADVDGDGAVEDIEREAVLVREWAAALQSAAAWQGWACGVYGSGSYKHRAARVDDAVLTEPSQRHIILYLHLNASASPATTYALICRDARSALAQQYAGHMALAWDTYLPATARGGKRTRVEAVAAGGVWSRAYNVVAPAYSLPGRSFGLLLEPWFLSALTGQSWMVYRQWMQATVTASVMGLTRIEEAWR